CRASRAEPAAPAYRSSRQAARAETKRAPHPMDAARPSSGHSVATMSHEIRIPLHGLMATIDMLREETPPPAASILITAVYRNNPAREVVISAAFEAGGLHHGEQ